MRIGIGVTTYNRPECLIKWRQQIFNHTSIAGLQLYIAKDTDEDRRGVAYRKNQCLRALKDCDYIFLFDDDCYPIKDGWDEFFIKSGEPHLLFLNDKLHNKWEIQPDKQTELYRDCGGVFMFMTKEVVNRVGAFNEKFDLYGFEHAEYSIRILGKHGNYPMLKGTDEYLYAEDYSNSNHKSSISDEEKSELVKKNWDKFFNESINSVFLPL